MKSSPSFMASPGRVSAGLMLLLILAATWVRLWRFPELPPAFNYDESYNVIDALWLRDTGSLTPFLPGNTGRHALFHYLAIPFLTSFGSNTFALRFLSVVIGILIIPLMYRWVVIMFAAQSNRYYLGLLAATGLTFSFWHITLSRTGFRASLLLLLYVLLAYLFWRGWQRQSLWSISGAGIALGLAQYTYWLAAIFPLQIGLFALIWTLWQRRNKGTTPQFPISSKKIWLGVTIMAVTSFIVFIPLGLFYFNTPLVLQYVSQSSITDRIANNTISIVGNSELTWGKHILTTLRIYLDGSVALWQGQWFRMLSFDWLVFIGFLTGLSITIIRVRHPASLFLVTGLITFFIPVLLNDIDFSDLRLLDMLPVHHAVSFLRAGGVLPLYYTVVAVGLLSIGEWVGQKFSIREPGLIGLATFLLLFSFSGLLNSYNFFKRWPQEPFIYERYNGPMYDLAQDLLHKSKNMDILIPFELYTHPTMHLLFDQVFTESQIPPLADSHNSALVVTTAQAPLTAYMWLVRSDSGMGMAYLTKPQAIETLLDLSNKQEIKIFTFGAPLLYSAQTTSVSDFDLFRPQLIQTYLPNPVNYNWNDEVRLLGYQITPPQIQAGQALNLTLYWQNLTDQPLTHDIFIHAINSQAEGVSQVDNVMLIDGHRWRKGKLTPTHHPIGLSDQLEPGPYLIRLGLFNTRTGKRLSVRDSKGDILGDQVIFGLFYISKQGDTPTQPLTTLEATLGEQIKILGYSMPKEQSLAAGETLLNLEIYWQATNPVAGDYTSFTQLLDNNNQFVTGFDTPPLNGTYPTSLWQLEEVIRQGINLTLPAELAPGEYRLVTGMYDPQTGQRLAAIDTNGIPLSDGIVVLTEIKVMNDKIILGQP